LGIFDAVDLPILRALTSFAGRSSLFDHGVNALSRTDSLKGVLLFSLLWYAWFATPPGEAPEACAARRRHLIAVLVGSVLIVLLSRVLQLGLHIHQRPLIAGLGLTFPPVVDPASVNPWNSFPSDHAMLFFAFATGLWHSNRGLSLFIGLWTLVVICLTRVYLGLHYPSDVAAGALLGILCMVGFLRLPLQALWQRIQGWSEKQAAIFYTGAFLVTDQVAHLFDDIRHIGLSALHFLLKG